MTQPNDKWDDEHGRPPYLTLRGFKGGEARVWLDGRIDIIKDHPEIEGIKNAASYQHPVALPECGTSEKGTTISAKNAAGRELPAVNSARTSDGTTRKTVADPVASVNSAQHPAPAAPSDWQFSNETFARLEKLYEAALYAEKGTAMHGYEHEALARRVVYESLLRDVATTRSARSELSEQEPHGPSIDESHGLECYGCGLIALRVRSTSGDRAAVIRECREVVLSCSEDAHEAAKAKDATDYVAGYQDAVVDCDEALRAMPALSASGTRP